jgi:hypothetical protein
MGSDSGSYASVQVHDRQSSALRKGLVRGFDYSKWTIGAMLVPV